MGTLIREVRPKAREEHTCMLCRNKIRKGETYVRQTMSGEDGPYDFIEHEHCNRIASAIWHYADPDNGMCDDEFRDAVEALMSTFVCPYRCEKYDPDNGYCEHSDPMSDECLRRFDGYLKTHKLELVRGSFGFEWKMTEVKDAKTEEKAK